MPMLSLLVLLLACEDPAPATTPVVPTQNGEALGNAPPNGAGGQPGGPAGGQPGGPAGGPAGGQVPAGGGDAKNPTIAMPSAAECTLVSTDANIPKTAEQLKTLQAAGKSWTTQQIQLYYHCEIARIATENADWKKQGKSAEDRAKTAFGIRHDARILARAMLLDEAKIKGLEAADQQRFGDPNGPTFDFLVKKAQERGSAGDALYEDVYQAVISRPDVDRVLGI